LKYSTEESDNPDLRDRGFIYWRMLSNDPETAKSVILADKPAISEDSSNFESLFLDKMVENIGSLASIYYKAPEKFVKKIRDRISERVDNENEFEDEEEEEKIKVDKNKDDFMYSEGVKKTDN
jgi:AP-1 complex subunit beta-1